MTTGKYLTMFVNFYRTVTDGQSPVDVSPELLPDVRVPDVSMRILNGIHAARRMLEGNPRIKVVFLTICEDPDTCRAALELGAFGYAIKSCLANDLIPAIEHARDGPRFVSPGCD
jgi:DNA-binding NarL/FixJ family response regulator